MSDPAKILVDFVEGRSRGEDFERAIHRDPAIETLLKDESLRWHDTYIGSNPFDYLISLNYDKLGDLVDAQGAVELFLTRKKIPFVHSGIYKDSHDLFIRAQPRWLCLDPSYIEKHVIADAGTLKGKALEKWLNSRLKELCRFHRNPPDWIQSPEWPVSENDPMYFLGQFEIEHCELFHDAAACYVFIDPKSKKTKTIIQIM